MQGHQAVPSAARGYLEGMRCGGACSKCDWPSRACRGPSDGMACSGLRISGGAALAVLCMVNLHESNDQGIRVPRESDELTPHSETSQPRVRSLAITP